VSYGLRRFHFDSAAAGNALQPSEAAYVAALDSSRSGFAQAPDVVVLVLYALPSLSLMSL
jgi:hypothetical protein